MQVMIIAPRLGRFTPRTLKLDVYAAYLSSFLRYHGLEVLMQDCNWKGLRTTDAITEAAIHGVDTLVIMCNNTLLYGHRMRRVLDACAEMRRTKRIRAIWLTGYMASSFASDILAYAPDAVGICGADGITWCPLDMTDNVTLPNLISQQAQLLDEHPGLAYLDPGITFSPTDQIALLASRSCNARCSFCAYNNGQGTRWQPRSMQAVKHDISFVIERFGYHPITFADNDFLGNEQLALTRVKEFYQGVTSLGWSVSFSINTRSECLTEESLHWLAKAGLSNITVGLESLHPQTLQHVYQKRVDYARLQRLLTVADSLGITILLSYILWQPFLSMEQLRYELRQIMKIGRWRVPQLLVNARLKVVPATPLEHRLTKEGLLTCGPFERTWGFLDATVGAVYADLSAWHAQQAAAFAPAIANRDTDLLATILTQRKLAELAYLADRVGVEVIY